MKETKELILFAVSFSMAFIDALKDGKIKIIELTKFINPLMLADDAFNDIAKIGEEIKNMTPEKRETLRKEIADEFDLVDDNLEALIEDTLDNFVGTYAIAKRWVSKKK